MAAWLTQRAQAVEEMTGQLHTAAHLLRLAEHFNPEDALARHLSTVASLQDGLQGTSVCMASLRHLHPGEGGNVESCRMVKFAVYCMAGLIFDVPISCPLCAA